MSVAVGEPSKDIDTFRLMLVDETDSATHASSPQSTISHIKITLPEGTTQAVARWAVMPAPHETFVQPPMSPPVPVEVHAAQAVFDVPTTRPGAALVELAF